jgi:hypothetical protein
MTVVYWRRIGRRAGKRTQVGGFRTMKIAERQIGYIFESTWSNG